MKHFAKKIIKSFFKLINKGIWSYEDKYWIDKKFKEIRSFWLNSEFGYCHDSVRFGKIGYLHGAKYISINKGTSFENYLYLTAWKVKDNQPKILIGKNCAFGAFNHVTCFQKIEIGDNLLTGKWVTITIILMDLPIIILCSAPHWKDPLFLRGVLLLGTMFG